jgi:VWFA-related protein
MKTMNAYSIRFRTAWTGFLLLGFIAISASQENQDRSKISNETAGRAEKDYTVRVAVDEVRLDVVVLDKKGHQINNLTANDFEVYQDDLPMEVRSCAYIADQANPSMQPAISRKVSKTAPLIPMPSLERNQVRRVIAFVVDDLSMSFEQVYYARMSLKKFVEKQMEPGDLVAVLKTGRGNSALQLFLSDKQQLLARIETIHWGDNLALTLDPYYLSGIYGGQLSAVRYCIRALKDLPGRKALVLMTAQTTLPTNSPNDPGNYNAVDYQRLYSNSYNKMADDALRAGVVIHTLDIRGLEAPLPDSSGFGGGVTLDQITSRNSEAKLSLSQKTGGLFLSDSNFFVGGIGEVNEALKGYYLLSYTPPSTTFMPNRQDIYHRTKVKVKIRGSEVHTRDGFYGKTATSPESAEASNPLRDAIFSPFRYGDLKVTLASGYVEAPSAGYLVRSWLHLNLNELNMQKDSDGYLVLLETVSVPSDITGVIGNASLVHYKFHIPEKNFTFVREHGMRFSLTLPVKKPGAYYIRVAVKDEISGKIGSAYQFVRIPNLRDGRLALSDLFLINSDKDLDTIEPRLAEDNSQSWFMPITKRDDSKSPALRNYQPGDSFEYMSVVYNAEHDKNKLPDLESQFILYRDGQEIMKSQPQSVALKDINKWNGIPIKGKMVLENTLQEGDYVLQLWVKDKRAGSKRNLASQTLNFNISRIAQ